MRISDRAVVAQWVPGEGSNWRVEFGVNSEYAEGLTSEMIQSVIETVWVQEMKPLFKAWLRGNAQVRDR
jgi:hypothetical protein